MPARLGRGEVGGVRLEDLRRPLEQQLGRGVERGVLLGGGRGRQAAATPSSRAGRASRIASADPGAHASSVDGGRERPRELRCGRCGRARDRAVAGCDPPAQASCQLPVIAGRLEPRPDALRRRAEALPPSAGDECREVCPTSQPDRKPAACHGARATQGRTTRSSRWMTSWGAPSGSSLVWRPATRGEHPARVADEALGERLAVVGDDLDRVVDVERALDALDPGGEQRAVVVAQGLAARRRRRRRARTRRARTRSRACGSRAARAAAARRSRPSGPSIGLQHDARRGRRPR